MNELRYLWLIFVCGMFIVGDFTVVTYIILTAIKTKRMRVLDYILAGVAFVLMLIGIFKLFTIL